MNDPGFIPAPPEAGKIAALRLIREMVIAKTGDPTAVAAAVHESLAIINGGIPLMKDALTYLADTLADGIISGYGDHALEEINRTLSAAMLGENADSADDGPVT